eukprot:CAMPEP_0172297108 /NCGR_PEP_ID=MMETSP1058-20130122/251_1 /TAXON_ID=83371 /ORGANISM="Detonula confervacea, Strain CCMP 353" /LENGTH=242 /DNA_ID=CAMNT_0013006217 /DNA_START=116 /DNA_END=844 /DNA_ORIENTATION=+
MKLFLLTVFFGATAVSATEYATLRGSSTVEYAPPAPVDYDLATLWDELAAEATFMKIQVSEGRTTEQCKEDCYGTKDPNINRGRCAKNCDQIADKGGDSNTRTLSCNDCNEFGEGNRRDRCMVTCKQGQERKVEDCLDAMNCLECRDVCGTGKVLDECLDYFNCPFDNRDSRSCNSASTCGNCNSFCDNADDRADCRDDLNCESACDSVQTCDNCNSFCDNSSDKRDCRRKNCSAEELAKIE